VLGFFEAWDQDQELKVDKSAMKSNPYYDSSDQYKDSKEREPDYQDICFDDGDDLHEMEQYRAIARFLGLGKNEVSFDEGQTVHVIDKNDNGWWLIQVGDKEGRAPGSYLEPIDQGSEEQEDHKPVEHDLNYIAVADYLPQDADEIGLLEGTKVEVLEKNLDGWWKVRMHDHTGLAPSTYLRKVSQKGRGQIQEIGEFTIERSSDVYALPLKPPPRWSWKEKSCLFLFSVCAFVLWVYFVM
jgi:hypothetical protein